MFNGSNGGQNGQRVQRIPKAARWLSVVNVLLVLLILYAMGLGLSEVVRGLEESLVWALVGLGLLVGYVLIRWAKHLWSAALFSVSFGVLYTSMVVGRLWDELATLVDNSIFWWGTAFDALSQSLRGEFTLPSFSTYFIYIKMFSISIFNMLQRLAIWIWRYPRLTSDMQANLMAWGMLIWVLVIWVSWSLWRRGRPLEGVIPAFLVLAIARTNAEASSNVVLVMMGLTIALMILSSQSDREAEWIKRGLGYSELIRKNATQSALVLSLVLVVVSSGITSIDLDKLRERWDEFTTRHERSGTPSDTDADTGVVVSVPDEERITLSEEFVQMARGGLPTDFLIGSGPDLSEEVVLVAKVEELNPLSGEPIDVDPAEQTYYFRSLVYDRYTPQGWLADSGRIYTYQGGQEAIFTYTSQQRLIKQEVRFDRMISGLHPIYSVGDLAVADRIYSISWREGKGLSQFDDMFGATVESRSYEAYSVIPAYTEAGLRDALPTYPNWMIDRYLTLPSSVPDRVIDLAYELTNREFSVFDKAVAIEQYLRTFPYTLDLPVKPANRDIADYFLFEAKQGYCDYYASTMVVLARAVGIPARLAVGYVGGTYDVENDYYVITADQAHSWVEIYFPEYGWVTFEPTAGRAALDRQKDVPQVSEYFEREIRFEETGNQLSGMQITLRVLLGLLTLTAVGFVVWLRADIMILKRQAIEKAFARMYRQLLFLGRVLNIQQGIAQTPLEFAGKMGDRLSLLYLEHPRLKFLEKTLRRVENLVSLANKAAYHADPPDAFDRAQAVGHWLVIRRQLGTVIFWHWLMGLAPKIKINREKSSVEAEIG